MKIVLMNCPNPVLASPEAHFQLGLLYVGGALKKAGYDVSIQDMRMAMDVTLADIPEADLIGVTATSGEFHYAQKINQFAHRKGLKTMIGGAHATFLMETCLDFDYVIQGDGEKATLRLLQQPAFGGIESPLDDLSGYFPDWDLIGEKGFSRELFTGAGYGQGPLCAGSLTSRGCPNQCSYCRERHEVVRYRPIADVICELKDLIRRGVRHFRFYDDSITLNKRRTLELFGQMRELNIHWRAHTRADYFDSEIAEAAKAAGCEEMGFGFEAATDKILETIRKNETVAQYREAVKTCKEAGILCKAFWMVGLPGQRMKEIADICQFMEETRPDKWIVSLFAAYPGSDVWAHPENYNVAWLQKDLSQYWNFSSAPTISYHDNSAEEIWRQYTVLMDWLGRRFPR